MQRIYSPILGNTRPNLQTLRISGLSRKRCRKRNRRRRLRNHGERLNISGSSSSFDGVSFTLSKVFPLNRKNLKATFL